MRVSGGGGFVVGVVGGGRWVFIRSAYCGYLVHFNLLPWMAELLVWLETFIRSTIRVPPGVRNLPVVILTRFGLY